MARLVGVLLLGSLCAACARVPRTGCDAAGPTSLEGWYAAAEDTIAVLPSARGGLIAVSPGAQRLSLVGDRVGEEFTLPDWNAEGTAVEGVCSVEALEIRGESARIYRRVSPPYDHEEIRFRNGSVELAGLLLEPRGARVGVVMVHGSGESHRDNSWYLRIAHELASHGIAVLVPDKRGSGESSGDWRDVGFDVLADDAVAGIAALERHAGGSVASMGIVGVSQGGWVLPIALAGSGDVDFGVSLVGPGVTLAEQQRYVLEGSLKTAGIPEPLQRQVFRLAEAGREYMSTGNGWSAYVALLDSLRGGPLAPLASEFPSEPDDWSWSWGRMVMDVDPLDYWRMADKPGLVVLGTEDPSVPARETAERLAPLSHVDVILLEGMGHALAQPGSRLIDQSVLDQIVEWIEGLS